MAFVGSLVRLIAIAGYPALAVGHAIIGLAQVIIILQTLVSLSERKYASQHHRIYDQCLIMGGIPTGYLLS